MRAIETGKNGKSPGRQGKPKTAGECSGGAHCAERASRFSLGARLCYSPTHMSSPPALKRGIRFRDLVLFYVVSGMSVRWMASAAAAGPSILVVWVAALTCFFVPLAGSVMELSSRYPQEGGLYVWSREAF